jgi:protein PhnA
MAVSEALAQRAQNRCELCGSDKGLTVFRLMSFVPREGDVLVCDICDRALATEQFDDASHWRCLADAMWSTAPAVQVTCWRILNRLREQAWAQDLLDMLYLDDDTLALAKDGWSIEVKVPTKDSNGTTLQAGDSVTIVKDLDVKGTSFTAKRGTVVRGISLTDNPEHIEGRVNDTRIVLLTCYVKKLI